LRQLDFPANVPGQRDLMFLMRNVE
jgi:hypothetical protein